jgi:hypothetical protein
MGEPSALYKKTIRDFVDGKLSAKDLDEAASKLSYEEAVSLKWAVAMLAVIGKRITKDLEG